MDKEVLIQYCELKEEIKDIRRRKEKLEREIDRLGKAIAADTVKGTRRDGIYGALKATGLPDAECERKKKILEKYKELLGKKEMELLELTCRAEEYIETMDRSEVRTMFRLYYIDGLPWWKVAQVMNHMFPKRQVKFTEDGCWQRNKRFFDKI